MCVCAYELHLCIHSEMLKLVIREHRERGLAGASAAGKRSEWRPLQEFKCLPFYTYVYIHSSARKEPTVELVKWFADSLNRHSLRSLYIYIYTYKYKDARSKSVSMPMPKNHTPFPSFSLVVARCNPGVANTATDRLGCLLAGVLRDGIWWGDCMGLIIKIAAGILECGQPLGDDLELLRNLEYKQSIKNFKQYNLVRELNIHF